MRNNKYIGFRLPVSVIENIDSVAASRHLSRSALIRFLLANCGVCYQALESEDLLRALEEKAVVAYYCQKCARRTAHEHIYVKVKDGKYYEVPATLSDCIGLHVEPGKRCLSCGAVHILTRPTEVRLEDKK